jgi:hypothetical protein
MKAAKDVKEMQEIYRQLLSEYICMSQTEINQLLGNRSKVIAILNNPGYRISPNSEHSSKTKLRKCRSMLNQMNSLLERKKNEVLFWEQMTEKFGVSLADIDGIGKSVTDATKLSELFPELFMELGGELSG